MCVCLYSWSCVRRAECTTLACQAKALQYVSLTKVFAKVVAATHMNCVIQQAVGTLQVVTWLHEWRHAGDQANERSVAGRDVAP